MLEHTAVPPTVQDDEQSRLKLIHGTVLVDRRI